MSNKAIRKHLLRDSGGIAAVEFGIIAPAFLALTLGGLDLGHTLYTGAVLQGAVQKAARDAALETGSATATQTSLDNAVKTQVKRLHSTATVAFKRRAYRDFTKAAAATPEIDASGDGECPTGSGEAYTDRNNNNKWDRDGGNDNQGGARDVTVYTVTMSYPRMFGVAGLIGLSPNVELKAATVLANQPYGQQGNDGAPTTRYC